MPGKFICMEKKEITTKICKKCNKSKMPAEFYQYNLKDGNIGLKTWCISCEKQYLKDNPDKVKKAQLKHKYNITPEKYDEIYKIQKGFCPICKIKFKKAFDGNTYMKEVLVVDHNHITNKIRGLLCSKCNSAIGLLDEKVDNFKNAIKYLRKYEK